ncbi:hypothetical protein HDU67_001063 [Dinochytrium kinnereticum]|nr:hypothetical protein HDU67_001063 [Dinochytrium kinnereticum]
MHGITKLAALVSALAVSGVVAQQPTTNLQQGCVTNYDANFDYFPEKASILCSSPVPSWLALGRWEGAGESCIRSHAPDVSGLQLDPDHPLPSIPARVDFEATSSLKITYGKNYKVITNSLSNEVVVLYQCGTPRPPATVAPNANRTLAVPVRKVSISDTTSVTYLELLGRASAIDYTSGGAQYIVSPCVQAFTGVKDVNSTTPEAASAQLNSTDVFFQFFSSYPTNNSVVFPVTFDKTSLNRVDWLNFIGAFFNLEAKANTIVNAIKENYACIKAAATSATSTPKKTVAIVEYDAPSQFNENVESWKIVNSDYMVELINNAGGQVRVPETAGTKTATGTTWTFTKSADLIAALGSSDILIDQTFDADTVAETFKNFGFTETSPLNFIKNKQIYNPNKQINSVGGTGFYEEAVVLQNIVLSDLTSIFRPELFPASSYTRRHFRNFYDEPTVVSTAATCSNLQALDTVVARTATCPVIPTQTAAVTTTSTSKPSAGEKFGAGVVGVVAAVALGMVVA